MVCDLGYYQNETAQTSCKICPIGHNCFCREMSQPVTCDAGYVCDIEGITKRYMPCPPGSYCPSGAETSISLENPIEDSITPILCDVGTYCTNGAYTSQIIKDDYYTPQSCFSGANCARGSSNPQGIRDCLIGYFCID